MAIDGRITARVIDHFTTQGVPILSVHDSYLIDVFKTNELRETMRQAIQAEVPRAPVGISREGVGYDEAVAMAALGVGNLKEMMNRIPRYAQSTGYLKRKEEFTIRSILDIKM
jgi:hypothetical protein